MAAIVAALSATTEAAARSADGLLDRMRFRGLQRQTHGDLGAAVGVAHHECDDGGAWFGERTWVVLDGQVHNREELIQELALLASTTDAELIARAHERWSDFWPERVRGDLAVVIWSPSRKELTLVRDALGVRPLYWLRDRAGVRCATELMVLARTMDRVTPNATQMALFLTGAYDEREATLVQSVNAVPPAHLVVVGERGESRRRRYWHPLATHSSAAPRTIDECAEQFLDLFRAAVSDRLRTPSRSLFAEVSGGLDSTSVAAMAASLLRGRNSPEVRLVTRIFPGLGCDERSFSRSLADHLGLSILEVDPRAAPSLLDVGAGPHATGDVYFHPTMAMAWLQLRRTRELGGRTTLTGFGSDQLAHRAPAAEIATALRKGDVSVLSAARTNPRGLLRVAAELLLGRRFVAAMSGGLRGHRSVLNAEYARAVAEIELARSDTLRRAPHRDDVQIALAYAVEHTLTRPLANLDRLAAREHSEMRHPFLDRRLVTAVLSMPHAVTAGKAGELRKPMLRRATRALLPREISERRTKTIFDDFARYVVFERNGRSTHALRHGRVSATGVVRPEAAQSVSESAPLPLVISWLALDTWLRSLE